jgi:hypothetical protein
MIENRYATLSQELVDTDCTLRRSFIPQNAPVGPKMGKPPGVKFVFGRLPKRTNSPRITFEFGPIKIVVPGFGGPQKLAKAPE